MKSAMSLSIFTLLILLLPLNVVSQDFQGKAFYFSKSTMDLGNFGARMSEAQKKQETK